MRTVHLVILVLLCKTLVSQTFVSDKKNVWSFTFYEFAGNVDKEGIYTDTLYTIQKFPVKNDWKIYYDDKKNLVATVIHYDTIKKTVTTRHYQRTGKLLQEYCAKYKSKKKCNPANARLEDFQYLKMYRGDSLICEMIGQKQMITVKYRNSFTNEFFDQTMFFSTGSWPDDYIGSSIWRYYENGTIKSICRTTREDDEMGTTLFLECKNFDANGCIIADK